MKKRYTPPILRAVIFVSAIVFVSSLFSANPVVYSDNPARLIESDDPLVLRQGNWTTQSASAASGGSYLYSNSPDEVLTLYFTGPTIEVVYVAGTTLGILALEVDDTVLRSVITTAETTQFSSHAKIDYLTDEGHTLRVYASQGIVAVDAFYGSVVPSIKSDDPMLVAQENEERLLFCDGTMSLVSQSSMGVRGNGHSRNPSISASGQYVAFESDATNLVSNDTNTASDIFMRDRQTCATIRVSVGPNGIQANGGSYNPVISGNGRYIAFESNASNLVAGDTNGLRDVFVYDRTTSTTVRVSLSYTGTQAVGGGSSDPAISDDGRFIAFQSTASNLVTPVCVNCLNYIYLHDRFATLDLNRTIKLIGAIAYHPTISADGRYIAFQANYTYPSGFYEVYLYDRVSGSAGLISRPTTQPVRTSINPMISTDGTYITFVSSAEYLVQNDTNGRDDIFVYNRVASTYARASISSGNQQTDHDNFESAISGDGRYVAFSSWATNLVEQDTNEAPDVFVHTLENTQGDGRTIRVSLDSSGGQMYGGFEGRFNVAISRDGRYVAFNTGASLIPSDTGNQDVYVEPSSLGWTDTVALFNAATGRVSLVDTLQDDPPAESYTNFVSGVPAVANGGQWVMGDWDGDGQKTPGVYAPNGVFYTTNVLGDTTPSASWTGTWFGLLNRPAVAGRFSTSATNDCLGVVDSGDFPPYGTAYALYYTCDLSGGDPPKSFQWLSVLLPDNQGHTGTAQFVAGDFDVDGFDSIAIRRSEFIAFNNVTPSQGHAEFSWAQYIGAPNPAYYGHFVAGDWDNTGTDSFGLVYPDGYFYRRNDLEWNTGQYILQQVNLQSLGEPPNFTDIMAASWRLQESYVGGE